METIDIALASDHGYFCGLLVTAVSLARHASRKIALRFNVLDGGLSTADWESLREKLKNEHPYVEIRRLEIDETRYAAFPAWNYGSRLTYARLELADLITDAEFAIYCDVDFLWQADVAELWALRDQSFVLQGVRDGWPSTGERERTWREKMGLPFDFERYVCAGLLLVNLRRYRHEGVTTNVGEFLSRKEDVPFVDQTALNAVVRNIGLLPEKWHRFSRDLKPNELSGECVIHFAGDLPWRCDWRAKPLGAAGLAWHRFYGELTGVGTWGSLRRCFSVRAIVLRRILDRLLRWRLTRGLFFFLLVVAGHGGCLSLYREARLRKEVNCG